VARLIKSGIWAAVSVVRNEDDVIESFVRHNLTVFDRLYVTVHRSTDNTLDLLIGLYNEGLPIDIDTSEAEGFPQSKLNTALFRRAAQDADFIMALDADEFFVLNCPVDQLETACTGRVLFLAWHNYIPTPEDDEAELDCRKRMRHRDAIVNTNQHKCLVAGSVARTEGVYLSAGNQEVHYADGSVVPYVTTDKAYIAHYPLRSVEQAIKKFRTFNGSQLFAPQLMDMALSVSIDGRPRPDRDMIMEE
jgi:hypothetical protein